jgi:hypothetical protein
VILRLITIPENLDILPAGLAPICIEDHDSEGRPVNLEWIERGVRPIHRALCNLVTCVIGDVWAVSEIVSSSVHSLSRRYGHNLGTQPHAQVYARTRWEAKNAAAGGRRLRLGLDQSLDALDTELQNAFLIDSRDHASACEARLDVDALAGLDGRSEAHHRAPPGRLDVGGDRSAASPQEQLGREKVPSMETAVAPNGFEHEALSKA